MFGKKSSRKGEFANLGIPTSNVTNSDANESDGDLEKELMDLLKGDGSDDLQLDSDGGSGADEDEELLAELEAFCSEDKPAPKSRDESPVPKKSVPQPIPTPSRTGLSIEQILERKAMYESAIETLLDSPNPDSAKLNKLTDAIDQLNSLESLVKNGETVQLGQLPPAPESTAKSVPATQPTASTTTSTSGTGSSSVRPTEPSSPAKSKEPEPSKSDGRQMVLDYVNPQPTQDNTGMLALKKRLQEYKLAALQARDAGQVERGKQLLMASKCIGEAIQRIEAGEETFDPSTDMPPPPSEFEAGDDNGDDDDDGDANQSKPSQPAPAPAPTAQPEPKPNTSDQELAKVMASMATPVVSVDNLTKRMAYFQNMVNELQKDPSASAKQRRMGRIVKQYEEALVACKRGIASYNYASLPVPQGCPELTDLSQLGGGAGPSSNRQPGTAAATGGVAAASSSMPGTAKPDAAALLTKRQAELRAAAARAKQAGNIEQAKRYLISAHGMTPMIQAAAAGLPINKSQIPPPPNLMAPTEGSSITIFTGQRCETPAEYSELMNNKSPAKILLKILEAQEKAACDLLAQHQKTGERKFITGLYELAKSVSTDKNNLMHGIQASPYFELVNLPRLNINIDLGDDILEFTSVRGLDYPAPSGVSSADHLDTYVELQLSYPSSSEPTKLASEWAKHTNEPLYMFPNNRVPVKFKTRLYRQIVQSNRGLKATVYYRRGLLKSYGVLGTVTIPLSGLMHSSTMTHLGNLMTGYKASGGQLEVKLRQRSSLLGDSVTYTQKPWLRLSRPKPDSQQAASGSSANNRLSPRQVEHHQPNSSNSRLSPRSIDIIRVSPSRSPQHHPRPSNRPTR